MAKKTYKQKYKSKRKDYRTGGRVKAARGFAGEPMEPIERKKIKSKSVVTMVKRAHL